MINILLILLYSCIVICGLICLSFDIKNISKNNSREKAIFSLMDVFSEIKIKNQEALKSLLEKQNNFKNFIDEYLEENKKVICNIDDYVKQQKTQCSSLLEKRNKCELVFQELTENGKKCNDAFLVFQKNLNSVDASFKYNNDSDEILNDLRNSFHVLYTHRSKAIMKEIDDFISKLNFIFLKCTNFTDYFKPLFQTINIYNSRIETTMKYFEDKNSENIKNNEDLVKALETISGTITNNEMKMEKILGANELYLNKNLFVLVKILETYRSYKFFNSNTSFN